jgi:undecaprenyl-phosphate 4-deoxy-4-formamido-L-arabinose transferase
MSIERVSLVVPVFNEHDNLQELIRRCIEVGPTLAGDFELILVDDGSADDSAQIIAASAERHAPHVVGVFLNRNYGQHAAVIAGMAEARGDVIVTLDADLQNPPEEIPQLLAALEKGYDVAGGVRIRRKDSLFRVLASRSMNAGMRKLTGAPIGDYGCMLRAYRRPVVDAVLKCPERSPYIPALANSFANRIAEVPVKHAERQAGDSKYGLWKLINLYFDLLISTTTAPLRMLSVFGTIFAALGLAFACLLLVLRIVYGPEWAAQGVFTVFAVLFVFLGAQLIGMGLLGEYIGRISRDVRARPRYVIRSIAGRSPKEPDEEPLGGSSGAGSRPGLQPIEENR